MKLKGTRTTTESVEITTTVNDVLDELREAFLKKQGLNKDAYIRDNMWFVDVEYATSHSWTDEEKIREPTPEEIEVNEAFRIIRKYFSEK